jgi:hypothetical protein
MLLTNREKAALVKCVLVICRIYEINRKEGKQLIIPTAGEWNPRLRSPKKLELPRVSMSACLRALSTFSRQ